MRCHKIRMFLLLVPIRVWRDMAACRFEIDKRGESVSNNHVPPWLFTETRQQTYPNDIELQVSGDNGSQCSLSCCFASSTSVLSIMMFSAHNFWLKHPVRSKERSILHVFSKWTFMISGRTKTDVICIDLQWNSSTLSSPVDNYQSLLHPPGACVSAISSFLSRIDHR